MGSAALPSKILGQSCPPGRALLPSPERGHPRPHHHFQMRNEACACSAPNSAPISKRNCSSSPVKIVDDIEGCTCKQSGEGGGTVRARFSSAHVNTRRKPPWLQARQSRRLGSIRSPQDMCCCYSRTTVTNRRTERGLDGHRASAIILHNRLQHDSMKNPKVHIHEVSYATIGGLSSNNLYHPVFLLTLAPAPIGFLFTTSQSITLVARPSAYQVKIY